MAKYFKIILPSGHTASRQMPTMGAIHSNGKRSFCQKRKWRIEVIEQLLILKMMYDPKWCVDWKIAYFEAGVVIYDLWAFDKICHRGNHRGMLCSEKEKTKIKILNVPNYSRKIVDYFQCTFTADLRLCRRNRQEVL